MSLPIKAFAGRLTGHHHHQVSSVHAQPEALPVDTVHTTSHVAAPQRKGHRRAAGAFLAAIAVAGALSASPLPALVAQNMTGVDSASTAIVVVEHDVEHGLLPVLDPHPSAPGTVSVSPSQEAALTQAANQGDSAARATLSWMALEQQMGNPSGDLHGAANSWEGASVWAYGQTMVAAQDIGTVHGSDAQFKAMVQSLEKYREGDAYAPNSNGVAGVGNRFYDDNTWIGLAFMQAYNRTSNPQDKALYLQRAEQIFGFIQTGLRPGGLLWGENQSTPTFNTCDEGPAMELALQLHLATAANPHDTSDPYFQFALELRNDLKTQGLHQADGLYGDHVNAANFSKIDPTIRSYNQGTPMGADVLFYKITGDKQYLRSAQQTANAALDYFQQGNKLDVMSPGFDAIFVRNLEALNRVAPDARYTQAVQQYGNWLWNTARDPRTGLFDQGGIGRYGNEKVPMMLLDQAGIVQVFSILASPPATNASLT